jgi:hypothetical protein
MLALGLAEPAGAKNPWRQLHRPIDLPQLAPGSACPVSEIDPWVDWDSINIFGGSGIGPGPVYPGLGFSNGHLEATGPPVGAWFQEKLFWYVSPSYRGRVLIRGRRLDGPDPLRFYEFDRARPTELRIDRGETVGTAPPGSRGHPSGVGFRASGCYGFQIDGKGLRRVVVFTAATI